MAATTLERQETEDRYFLVWTGAVWQIRDKWYRDRHTGEETTLAATRDRLNEAAELAGRWNRQEKD